MNSKELLISAMVIVIIVFVGNRILNPSNKEVITKKLYEIAQLTTKKKGDNVLTIAGNLKKAVDYFNFPVEASIHKDDGFKQTLIVKDKAKLKQHIVSMKLRSTWFIVKLSEIDITVNQDQADVMTLVRMEFQNSEAELVYDEYAIQSYWVKIDREWLIRGVNISRP